METLQAKIERLETELAEINENETFTQDLIDRKNQVTNDLSEARHNLNLQQAFEQAQQVREQKQTEQLDSLGQQIQDMNLVGMILPENQLAGTGISLTEYGELRQKLNQLLHTWATEIQQATYKTHNAEVAELQKQVREARVESAGQQEQNLQLKRQNDELQKELQEITQRRDSLYEKNIELEMKHDQLYHDSAKLGYENQSLTAQIAELQQKLAEAQKPTPAIQTSQSVQEQLEGLRKKSAESWTDKANRGLARFDLPPIGAPDLPPMEVAQPGNTFPTSESTGDPLPATEASVGERFQEGEQSDGLSVDRDRAVQKDDGQTVTREEFEALQGRVAKLETEPMRWGA